MREQAVDEGSVERSVSVHFNCVRMTVIKAVKYCRVAEGFRVAMRKLKKNHCWFEKLGRVELLIKEMSLRLNVRKLDEARQALIKGKYGAAFNIIAGWKSGLPLIQNWHLAQIREKTIDHYVLVNYEEQCTVDVMERDPNKLKLDSLKMCGEIL